MSSVLLIGGAGFIGSHLADLCLERGHSVCVYDDFSTGRREFLPASVNLQVLEGDILDTELLSDAVATAKPETVYHLAAIHHIPTCERIPERALRVNVEGTQSVLTACSRNHAPERIIFASTGALYDPALIGPLDETSRTLALDVYSVSKMAGEQLVRHHVSKGIGRAVIARLFNAVGRRETNPHLVPDLVAQLARGTRTIRVGNLHPRRDYIHVADAAAGLYALSCAPGNHRIDVFNVGTGCEHSVQGLLDAFSLAIGEPLEVVSDPELRRSVDRASQLADCSRLQRVCGWRAARTLEDALSEVWREHLERSVPRGSTTAR